MCEERPNRSTEIGMNRGIEERERQGVRVEVSVTHRVNPEDAMANEGKFSVKGSTGGGAIRCNNTKKRMPVKYNTTRTQKRN